MTSVNYVSYCKLMEQDQALQYMGMTVERFSMPWGINVKLQISQNEFLR